MEQLGACSIRPNHLAEEILRLLGHSTQLDCSYKSAVFELCDPSLVVLGVSLKADDVKAQSPNFALVLVETSASLASALRVLAAIVVDMDAIVSSAAPVAFVRRVSSQA